ncbi:histidine phosphatase family protein [Nitratidesulfovibrio vulgaris]|uniref:Phosphoglycerate mutase family protein n=1 Tax=Nitratidesulfovibrio vulgaris (strain ATCC 29579 / DSM 644 / CCUG 34227 / NCIMB 8303 / VKM B-1760 / Hildenborough) TaxID=882 RepID=Q72BT4_NITV2|nr:histidine phosphatase family protein [Nitratidesulfovibrio vulgaris]AAS96028.1 phosphoglycerate mutase family protein [Nitratidesulfovibrio vulgaris str. Hildenborough]
MTVGVPAFETTDTPEKNASRAVILLRHAATTGGEGRAIGRTPLPLSPEGLRQAAALCKVMRQCRPAALYASPASRARDTLGPLLDECTVHLIDDMDEIDMGQWDGRTFDSIRQREPEQYNRRGRDMAHFKIPGGETFADVQRRVMTAVRHMAQGPRPAVCITHAGCLRVVACTLTRTRLEDLMSFRFSHLHGLAMTGPSSALHLEKADVTLEDLPSLL